MPPSEDVICNVLGFLVGRHAWGSPWGKDAIVNLSGVSSDRKGEAKEAVEHLREEPYIDNFGNRGIQLDNSEFEKLANYLYYTCGWDALTIKSKLKHYEGWVNHDWI